MPRADGPLAVAGVVVLADPRGVLPAVFALAMGAVTAVQNGADLTGSLTLTGAGFVLLQVAGPLHTAVSTNLFGDRTAAC